MSNLRASIIIPVFQDQERLNRCLRYIDKQANIQPDTFETIVVDNGSRPRITLPGDIEHRVRLFNCEIKGSYAARNEGVRHAQGEVIVFLDADCWPEKNWLFFGLKQLDRLKLHSIVGGGVKFVRSSNPSSVEIYQCMMGFGQERAINELGFSVTANLFVSRKLFNVIGDFDESLLSGGDREWCWRALAQGYKVSYSPDALVWTDPRRSFRSAFTQARRVAGGRMSLRKDVQRMAVEGSRRVFPERGVVHKVLLILENKEFSVSQRFRALAAALAIKCVHDLEKIRLRIGFEPERR